MPNTNNIILNINGQNNTGPAFQQVQSQAQQAASNVEKAFSTVGNSMKSVGKAMTAAITVPVMGVVASSVKVAMGFEEQMSKVSAISGATGEDLQALTEKAQEMGSKTKFKASEAGQAMEYMAMAGWKTKDMLNGIEGIMNLAAASGEDLATVSDIVTDAMTAFGMQASESGRFADILASASSNANTNVSMLGESFKYVAPVMGSLGMSAEDAAIALGLMANSGIKGSQAGTSLKNALVNLSKPTAQMQKELDKLGISLTDNQGNTKSLKQIMDEMRISFSGLTEAEQAQAAATIFGKNSMAGMLAIINASEQDYNKLTSAVYSSSDGIGKASEMSQVMLDNLSGQLTLLGSAWESIQLKIADSVMPTIKKFVGLMQKVADAVNKMKPETLDLIVKIGLVVAAIGPLLIILGSVVTSIIKIKTGIMGLAGAFKTLGTTFSVIGNLNPWVWIIAGIIVLVTVLTVLIIKNWDKIKETWKSACDFMSKKWREFCDWIKPGLDKVSNVFKGIAKKLGLDDELEVIKNTLKNFKWWDYILPTGGFKIFDALFSHKTMSSEIKLKASEAAQAMKHMAGLKTNDMLKGDGITPAVKKLGQKLVEGFNYTVKPIVDVWKKIIEKVKSQIEFMKKVIMSIIAIVYHLGEKIIAPIQKVLKKVLKTIQTVLRPIKAFIRNLINNVKEVFVTGFNYIKNKVQGIFGVISNVFKKLKSFYGKVVEVLRPVVTIVENFKKGFETIMDKIVEIFMSIYEKYEAFVEKFRNFIADVKKDLCDFINAIINGINHLTSGINKLKFTISGVEELGIPDINWDFNIPQIDNLPSLSIGTSEVLKDGLAVIHKGEAVVPAQVNPWRNDVVATNGNRQIIEVHITDDRNNTPIVLELDGRTITETVLKRANVLCNVRG